MSYDQYRYIFIIALILCGIMLAVSVVLFFYLNIAKVIGDLSGANAKKAIDDIRSQNEKTGYKTYKTSAVNRERGKLTDKISASGKLIKNPTMQVGTITSKIDGGVQETVDETTLLDPLSQDAPVFEPVSQETTILDQYSQDTTVLGSYSQETTVLNSSPQEVSGIDSITNKTQDDFFVIEREITFTQTDEVIPIGGA